MKRGIGYYESWEVTFQVKSKRLGTVFANDVNTSRIYYVDYFENENFKLFPKCLLNVLSTPPLPPKLYIEVNSNKDDIFLYWDEPPSAGTHHYLIYRATSPTGFDFSTPWVDTSNIVANGIDPIDELIIPARRSWNHTDAADPKNKEYSQQIYYCIRTVNYLGEISYTSRTVGKWTKIFNTENATFSLPLEPLEIRNVEFYTQDMNARFIKWMDPQTHMWVQHDLGESGDNNTIELGKGYEVSLFSADTKYTFVGMPGAMIKYKTEDFAGFDADSDAKSLSASVNHWNGEVTLSWNEPIGMDSDDQYYVYFSRTRDGFYGTEDIDFFKLTSVSATSPRRAIHPNAAQPGFQYYYMIIPVNESGVMGASTYSIGVFSTDYLSEYDTMGIPLILDNYPTVDWFCNQMENVVGMNYFIESENRWSWHSTRMPEKVYDPVLEMIKCYQLSTSNETSFIFIGH
jgi:hypothetical protein